MAAANRLEARFSRKHAHTWVGYKVHLSEICDESQPHLITQVATAISTSSDIEALPKIHQGLADKSLLPSQHLVDTGYISAEMLVESKETYQVDLVGPARQDYKWPPRPPHMQSTNMPMPDGLVPHALGRDFFNREGYFYEFFGSGHFIFFQ